MSDLPASTAQAFRSILFPDPGQAAVEDAEEPECFHDLHLDQIVATVAARAEAYDLVPFFRMRPGRVDTVNYRQEVMRDLEQEGVRQAVALFAARMQAMRKRRERAEKCFYGRERERWLLDAMSLYAEAVERLAEDLRQVDLASRGLGTFRDYLADYAAGHRFQRLVSDTRALEADLAGVRYGLLIKGNSVTVRRHEGEADFSAAVEAIFRKFRQGAVRDYRASFRDGGVGINHVEAQILERVALLFPAVFQSLGRYVEEHADDVDEHIARFDREIQFYLAYLAHMQACRRRGLDFCYPEVSQTDKAIEGREVFDLALATALLDRNMPLVRNDFRLDGAERIFVVTGPNHGGKTTFARTIGQMHWLAGLGLPVPGVRARLFLCDDIFTHFEREEDIASLRGKLKDDLVRIRRILDRATPDSLIVMNEIFASTTLRDATYLGRKVLARLSELDLLGVCVTFLAGLAGSAAKTVSMTSLVDPHDPAVRTYKVVRRPADGVAYALAIAEKYRVTRRWLLERIAP